MSDAAASDWGWWRERRLPAERIHLDSAAAGRSSRATLAVTAEIATHGDGAVDLAALERMLAGSPPAFMHLTQVTCPGTRRLAVI
jgi:hypothetical protein